MKRLWMILLGFLLISCHINGEYHLYTFVENSELDIITYNGSYMKWGQIKEGKNLVFEYVFSAEEDSRAEDDEYSEYIKFEIDPELTSFNYSDSALHNTKIVFTKSCFCDFDYQETMDVEPYGTISGEKVSNTEWNINLDIIFYGNDQKQVSGIFKLKES